MRNYSKWRGFMSPEAPELDIHREMLAEAVDF
jgi:hypothetical protein